MGRSPVSDHVHTFCATPLEDLSQHLSPEAPTTVFRGHKEFCEVGSHAISERMSEADDRAVVIERHDRGCPRRQ